MRRTVYFHFAIKSYWLFSQKANIFTLNCFLDIFPIVFDLKLRSTLLPFPPACPLCPYFLVLIPIGSKPMLPKKKSQDSLIASLLYERIREVEINACLVPKFCSQRKSASQPGVPEYLAVGQSAWGLALKYVWTLVFSV